MQLLSVLPWERISVIYITCSQCKGVRERERVHNIKEEFSYLLHKVWHSSVYKLETGSSMPNYTHAFLFSTFFFTTFTTRYGAFPFYHCKNFIQDSCSMSWWEDFSFMAFELLYLVSAVRMNGCFYDWVGCWLEGRLKDVEKNVLWILFRVPDLWGLKDCNSAGTHSSALDFLSIDWWESESTDLQLYFLGA